MGRHYRRGGGAQSTGANNVPLANPRSWVSTAPAPSDTPKAPMRPAPAPRRPVGRGAGNNIPEWMKKGVTAAAPSLPSSAPAAPVDPSVAAAARAPVANPLAGFQNQAGGGQHQQHRAPQQQQSQGGIGGGRQSYGGQQSQQSQGGYGGARQSYGGMQQQQSFGGQQGNNRGNSTRDAPAAKWPPAGLSGTLMSGQLPAGVDAVVEAKEVAPMVNNSAPASTPASFGRVKALRAQGMANADIAKLRVQAISMLLSGGGMMQQQSYGGYQQPQMQMQQPMGGYQQQQQQQQQQQAVAPGGFPGAGAPGGFPGASGPGGFQR